MKSRVRPLESPDQPYMSDKVTARARARELSLSEYKTSLTPPSWPAEATADATADRKLARAETALDEVARREQVLAMQVKAHRDCVAQLAEERALLDAERNEHAKKVKLAEDALARRREELSLESENLIQQHKSLDAARQEAARIATEVVRRHAEKSPERVGHPAPDAGKLLPQLAKQAADFAALTETVTRVQQELVQARAEHDATVTTQMDDLRKRGAALAQRESEAEKRINTATLQLDADLQRLERAQMEFAAAERKHAEWQLKLEATELDVAKREKELALNSAKLNEEQARLIAKGNAITAVEVGQREREAELLRLEQDLRQRASDLARHRSELTTAEEQVRTAGQEAVAAREAIDRLRSELDAGLEKLRSDREAVALVRQEQSALSAALEQRSAELAKREAAVEHVTREVVEVRQQALELRNERAALDAKVAELESREKGLEEKRVAFDECRRKFRETFSSFMSGE